MSTENKKLIVVGVITLIVGLALGNILFGTKLSKLSTSGSDFAGAPGNLLAEDYDPYVQYNGGFNTAKGITNSGTLTQSGASTISGALTLSGVSTISGASTFTSTLSVTGDTSLERTTLGGAWQASSTALTTQTLQASDFTSYKGLDVKLTGGGMTYTLPASSTLSAFVPNAGDEFFWYVAPQTNAITFIKGTGTFLLTASSTDVIIGNGNIGRLHFLRSTSTDLFVNIDEYTFIR